MKVPVKRTQESVGSCKNRRIWMPGHLETAPSSAADLLQAPRRVACLGFASLSPSCGGFVLLAARHLSPCQAQCGLGSWVMVRAPCAHHPAGLFSEGCSPLLHQEGSSNSQAWDRAAHASWLHTPVSTSSIKCHKSREISR